jgi:hypothetical protein
MGKKPKYQTAVKPPKQNTMAVHPVRKPKVETR